MHIQSLSDDELYSAFADADDAGDDELCRLCIDEIERRCRLSPSVVHELPSWLSFLPRVFWHSKPVGEGRG